MVSKASMEFVEFEPKELSRYTLIEGFPGMGLVGTIAAKYIIERLKFKPYGYIASNIFMPIIRIHMGLPVNPARIYISDQHKLIVLIAEQIIPRQHTDLMAEAVVSWINKKGIKKLVSLSGIHAEPHAEQKEGKKPIIYGIASDEESKKELEKYSIEIIEEGITTGVTALILLKLRNSKVNACSIMGDVKIAADYEAAAELIKKLNEMFGFELDVEPLLKEAKETEREILKQLQKLQKTKDLTTERFEAKPPMYA